MGKKLRDLERKITGFWGDDEEVKGGGGKGGQWFQWLGIRFVGEGYQLLRRHRLSIL
jgi:hypothetical protein